MPYITRISMKAKGAFGKAAMRRLLFDTAFQRKKALLRSHHIKIRKAMQQKNPCWGKDLNSQAVLFRCPIAS
jgi:hypothetical protein